MGRLPRRRVEKAGGRVRGASALAAGVVLASVILSAAKPPAANTIVWSGATWTIKTSQSAVGPGPNLFSKSNVSVDANGNLHLQIAKTASNQWTCAEIIAPASYGYGTYTFDLASRVDALDPNVVLGLFTWSDRPQYANREIDIEFARWGVASDPANAQYVVQPYDRAGHLRRYTHPAIAKSRVRFMWQA